MKLFEIFFSPTGGTGKVADILAGAWNSGARKIDLTDRGAGFALTFDREDICIVAVPSFGGRVPGPAVSRLKEMTGGGACAVLAVVYGNRAYDDTFRELEDILTERGFRCRAAVAAVAEHSIMRQFAAGRPDDEDCAELAGYGRQIRELMEGEKLPDCARVPGNREYRPFHGVPFKPKAGHACSGCGLCARLCPVGAIPEGNPSGLNEELCISCMRCVSVCPARARRLNGLMLLAASQKMKKEFEGRKKNELFIGG